MKKPNYSILLLILPLFFFTSSFGQFNAHSDSSICNTFFLDSLRDDNIYRLKLYASGCFRKDTLDIRVSKAGSGYYVTISSISKIMDDKPIKYFKHKNITSQQRDGLRNLERDLAEDMAIMQSTGNVSGDYGCTDIVEYNISINNQTKEYVDMACRIKGLSKLRGLFSIKQQ